MVKFFFTENAKAPVQIDGFEKTAGSIWSIPATTSAKKSQKFRAYPKICSKPPSTKRSAPVPNSTTETVMFIVDCPLIEENGGGGDDYTTIPLAVIYNGSCIVTVCLKGNTVLKDFITGRESIDTARRVHFLLTFMLCNAKRFLYYLKQIDRKTHRIQSEMERTMRNSEIIQLLDLQNSLVYFSTSLNSNERVHEKLFKVEGVATKEEYRDLYDDIIIESRQAIETCNIYKNILSVTMDAYGSVISNNANDTMKKLTIVTILLAIPTMIAGFFGMNMPVPWQSGVTFKETGWFWLVVALTLVFTFFIGFLLLKNRPFRKRVRRKKKQDKRNKEN